MTINYTKNDEMRIYKLMMLGKNLSNFPPKLYEKVIELIDILDKNINEMDIDVKTKLSFIRLINCEEIIDDSKDTSHHLKKNKCEPLNIGGVRRKSLPASDLGFDNISPQKGIKSFQYPDENRPRSNSFEDIKSDQDREFHVRSLSDNQSDKASVITYHESLKYDDRNPSICDKDLQMFSKDRIRIRYGISKDDNNSPHATYAAAEACGGSDDNLYDSTRPTYGTSYHHGDHGFHGEEYHRKQAALDIKKFNSLKFNTSPRKESYFDANVKGFFTPINGKNHKDD